MPTIPKFLSERSITTSTPSVKSNLNLDLNQTPASALQPVSNFIRDSYIKEKQIEANNKSYKLLNDFYEDQKDEQGNITQKGWLTITSEAKVKPNPTEASKFYETEVNKLYNYHKINKFTDLNNFEKKAIESKFYATSGLLKTKVLEEARVNLIQENKKIDEDTFVKESLLLQQLGTIYIPAFKDNTINRISANPNYDDGTKKQLIDLYTEKGIEFLATSMANNNPIQFKEARKKGSFDDVSAAKILELEAVATEQIKQQKFITLLAGLDVPFDADPRDFVIANEEIKNKTFGNNQNLINIYNSFTPQEIIEFDKAYQKKASAVKTDRNILILTSNQVAKVEAAQKTNEVFKLLEQNKGVYTETLQRLFPNNQIAVEQLIDYNSKVADGTSNQVSKFEYNDDIIKLIIDDKINSVYDKFNLVGETDSMSIIDRVGKQLNTSDVKFLNNLLSISNENNFKNNHTKFFKFIEMFSLEVAGSSALKNLDSKRDDRLNNFKYTMYGRYINGLKNGLTPDELLKGTKGNKNFIGYDFHTFIPNMDDVFKDIRNNLVKNNNSQVNNDEQKPKIKILREEKEKELGRKLTPKEILDLAEGL